MHQLLARQLRRLRMNGDAPPDAATWPGFLDRISATYADIDRERYVYERSMTIASREMEEMAARVTATSELVAAQRDRLAAVLGSLGDGVLVIGSGGVIESANPEAHDLLGYEPGALEGRPVRTAVRASSVEHAPDDHDATRPVTPGTDGSTGAVRVANGRGGSFIADLATRTLLGGDQDAVVVMVLRDITEAWRAGREREALERLSRAVARRAPLAEVHAQVAAELAALLGVRAAVVAGGGGAAEGWVTHPGAPLADARVDVAGRSWGRVVVDLPLAEADQAARHSLTRFAEIVSLAVADDEAHRSLVALATTDALTGLNNARAFHERLAGEVDEAARYGHPLTLVVLDIDHFKQVNDVHGHPVGDQVLEQLARRLSRAARAGDFLGRIGGEEFAWLMPGTDLVPAVEAAERTRAAVRATPFPVVGTVTASLGACALEPGLGRKELLERADAALYWAKRFGRDAVFPYTVQLQALTEAVGSRETQARSARELLERVGATMGGGHAEHAERVGALADELAGRLMWPPGDRRRLREAAMLHDLAAVGVPGLPGGGVAGTATAWTGAHLRAGLAAASGVLDEEQARWVRDRHRRWSERAEAGEVNGRPTGACIIAVADMWDTLVHAVGGEAGTAPEEAFLVVNSHAGGLLSPVVVPHLRDAFPG